MSPLYIMVFVPDSANDVERQVISEKVDTEFAHHLGKGHPPKRLHHAEREEWRNGERQVWAVG